MSRILIATTPERGHINPMVGVAQRLAHAGHHVGWLCLPRPAEQLHTLDVELLLCDVPVPPMVTSGPDLAALVRTDHALRDWIRTLLLDGAVGHVEPVAQVISRFGADVVVTDPMLYGVVIAAHRAGRPWVGVSSSLNPVVPPSWSCRLTDHIGSMADARDNLFAQFGMTGRFAVADCLSPWLTTVFATPELVGSGPYPEGVEVVGPSLAEARGDEVAFPWHRLDNRLNGRPLIYASFGSQISYQPELFGRLIRATRGLDVQLVCSAGALLADALDSDHVLAVPYAPQREILSRAKAFVTHGGANSAMEARVAGVPTLVLPICNDQPLQARFTVDSGAGLALDPDDSVEILAEALRRLVGGECDVAASRLARSYARRDGAQVVARRIAQIAESA